jgi:prepilin-type N-terminal cleavage/methylation domain-containing protein
MTRRHGFTLIELMVALGMGLLAAAVTHGLLVSGQRLSRTHAERAALYDNVRAAAHILAAELGPLGRDEITPDVSAILGYPAEIRSDLMAIEQGAVTYLAGRGQGVVCGTSTAPAEIRVPQSHWQSPRAPRATDSLLVLAEGDSSTAADNVWLHLGVLATAGGTCPDGRAALVFRVGVPPSLDPALGLRRVSVGAIARLAEAMQLRYYESGAEWWLGMRSVSTGEAITPVAGPLADSTDAVRGLTLTWLDAWGAPTDVISQVRAVDVALRGVTGRPIHARNPARAEIDSFGLAARIVLRNAAGP